MPESGYNTTGSMPNKLTKDCNFTTVSKHSREATLTLKDIFDNFIVI